MYHVCMITAVYNYFVLINPSLDIRVVVCVSLFVCMRCCLILATAMSCKSCPRPRIACGRDTVVGLLVSQLALPFTLTVFSWAVDGEKYANSKLMSICASVSVKHLRFWEGTIKALLFKLPFWYFANHAYCFNDTWPKNALICFAVS